MVYFMDNMLFVTP